MIDAKIKARQTMQISWRIGILLLIVWMSCLAVCAQIVRPGDNWNDPASDCITQRTDTIVAVKSEDMPFYWHGHRLTHTSEVVDSLFTQTGCDSIVILRLYIIGECDVPFSFRKEKGKNPFK